jgi:CRP/FNR family cyclic AMP-dependent transcriptional regulator
VIEPSLEVHQSKQQIWNLFHSGSRDCRAVKIRKNKLVYASGDRDAMVYCVEKGQIKEVLISPEGKECLLAIHTTGDILGELCLCGQIRRFESAIAMQDSLLRRIPGRVFLNMLRRESLMECLVQFLVSRMSEQWEVITTLLTVNSEQRLARTLLRLASSLGREHAGWTRIIQRLRHEELAEMVGLTRSRIGFFLRKFRTLGLVETDRSHCLLISERGLEEYTEGFESSPGRGGCELRYTDQGIVVIADPDPPRPCQSTRAV